MSEKEELFSHCSILIHKVARSIKLDNPKVSYQVQLLADQFTSLLNEYRNGPSQLAEPVKPSYGLYNDHKLEYGVPLPEKDDTWTLQTK